MNTFVLTLEDLVTAVYCALDDALQEGGLQAIKGKLIARRGPKPEVDDREVLCLSVLQELLGFESDHEFHLWLNTDRTMRALFPVLLSRQKFAQRRLILAPLVQRLSGAFCNLVGEGQPPFSSSIAIPSMSVVRRAPKPAMPAWAAWPRLVTAPARAAGTAACASI